MQRAESNNLIRKIGTTWLPAFSMALLCYLAGTSFAYASSADFSTVAENITNSASSLPGLLTALAYGLGLMMGVSGIVKIKEHVETPNQAPLRSGIVRLLVGGGLFALPIIYEAMTNTIGVTGIFATDTAGSGGLGTMNAAGAGTGGGALNDVFNNIMCSTSLVPGLFTAVAYLIGILSGVSGLLKIREHVETPDQVALKEPVIRLLSGGAMFALPTMMQAAMQTINGGGNADASVFDKLLAVGGGAFTLSSNGGGSTAACDAASYGYGTLFAAGTAVNGDLGYTICNAVNNSSYMPALLSGLAYIFGIVLIIWGVAKIKDNVLNPQQTTIWEGISRLIAGGSFFALPYLMDVVTNTLNGSLSNANGFTNNGFTGDVGVNNGLDAMMANFTADMFGPMLFTLNFFGYTAGTVLLMVGISRLLKSAQEGPRGPGGIGTIMTFLAGGALISLSPMVGALSETFFNGGGFNGAYTTKAALQYSTGMNASEIGHVQAVVSSILQFMIVLGVVAFLRGIYIIREVAEGNSQASLMAGITHMMGGALAVNLGSVMNAIQTTLGLTAYGINFS
jgi:hypothetical protein